MQHNIFTIMKKILIIGMVFAFSVSFDVGHASNVVKTEKSNVFNDEFSTDLNVVLSHSNFQLKNDVAILENEYVSFNEKTSLTPYKMGKLKNKVNNFHMFYRIKLC